MAAIITDEHELRIIAPLGMLGYGYDASVFLEYCEKRHPHAIICDSGSTDSGPQKLALGLTTCPREAYVRDLGPMLLACAKYKIPILIGSCGGSGTNEHVDLFAEIIHELALEHGYRFRIAKIYSEFDKAVVRNALEQGNISPCGPVPPLTVEDVDASRVIVGQMGAEPYLATLNTHEPVDIILGGRAYDPAPFAAVCLKRGIDPGIAWHMGKLECGGMCVEPKQPLIFATIRKDSFDLEPTNDTSRCTAISVAAHTLYEKTRPDLLPGPGGVLNLAHSTYEQLTPRIVRVRGAVFEPRPYQIKLEGAKKTGFRSVFIGGIRDAGLIAQIDHVLPVVENYARTMNPKFTGDNCRIAFHVYGKNGVMGPLEPVKQHAHELCVLCEVLAPTQGLAHSVCNALRVALLHTPYAYQVATGGNLAGPLTPMETDLGEASEFCVYHLINVDDPLAPFPITYQTVGTEVDPSRWPTYTHLAHAEMSSAARALEEMKKEMEGKKVDPVAQWRRAIEHGDKTIKLRDVATVLRSKNSGPYELTFDVMFPNEEIFQAVQNSGVLTKEILAKMYGVKPETVLACLFFPQARAFKFTIPRVHPNGSFGETDMHGCQQHIPLGDIDVPLPIAAQ
ncbi:uncharacterized protein LAESUDRAFT_732091 [Laetiporus sulphureus 93-53]|uniref:DUF1446-domain-containing protein n=1 Tax=Laetiporus sulphureus 93-53 TaxID=1314785 RepID=A0A165BBF9_9APHY|nr:uncharacterized protein LAESUDRAFT_732091 [Laetiporus sulphureus 93-53]KZT00674.1 hypothetical protein LAESUDRAFT_732091 [Laetiporus sulphureus 93-53]